MNYSELMLMMLLLKVQQRNKFKKYNNENKGNRPQGNPNQNPRNQNQPRRNNPNQRNNPKGPIQE